MPRQTAVTIRASIAPGRGAEAMELLQRIRAQQGTDAGLPFSRLEGLHFARLFILEEVEDLDGTPIPSSMVYMSDVDGDQEAHLRDLATVAGSGIDAVFQHCESYPAASTIAARAAWLAAHALAPAAVYVHTAGRGVDQVRDEARLREALELHLDTESPTEPPGGIVARLRRHVAERPDLASALSPADATGAPSRAASVAQVAVLALVALALLPVLLPVLVVFLVLIRIHEQRDIAETGPVDAAHADEVEQYEDWATQNPFTAIGFVKPGFVRHTTMRVALAGLDFANHRFFAKDNLAGVRTLHFARWVPMDNGRRLIFASSYDGSQESYMNDFIDRLAWGLNLVFSNGVGYPSTRWLLFGGAHDETAFKRYLRRHQIPTVVWYSAYPTLHAPKVDQNAELRRGLGSDLDDAHAAQWLALL